MPFHLCYLRLDNFADGDEWHEDDEILKARDPFATEGHVANR